MYDKVVLLFPLLVKRGFREIQDSFRLYSPIQRIFSYFRFSFILYYTPYINLVFIAYYHVCFHVCQSCHLPGESAHKEHRYVPSYYNGGIRCSPHPRPPKRLVTQTRAFGWGEMTSVTFCHILSQSVTVFQLSRFSLCVNKLTFRIRESVILSI